MTPLLSTFGEISARGFGLCAGSTRKSRVISFTPTPLGRFKVRIVLNTSNFNYASVKPDGSDIRFSGTGAGSTSPYWIESWNPNGTSVIWVDIATNNTSSVTMTYGYPERTASSSIDDTMGWSLQFMYYAGGSSGPFASLDGGGFDESVNYVWGSGTVSVNGFGSRADNVSIRWKGWLVPSGSGTHTLYCTTDDGSRVYVGSSQDPASRTLLINAWFDQGPTEYSGSVSITDGKPRYLEYEWFESGGGATAQLGLATPTTGKTYGIWQNIRGPKYHSAYGDPFLYAATVGAEVSG